MNIKSFEHRDKYLIQLIPSAYVSIWNIHVFSTIKACSLWWHVNRSRFSFVWMAKFILKYKLLQQLLLYHQNQSLQGNQIRNSNSNTNEVEPRIDKLLECQRQEKGIPLSHTKQHQTILQYTLYTPISSTLISHPKYKRDKTRIRYAISNISTYFTERSFYFRYGIGIRTISCLCNTRQFHWHFVSMPHTHTCCLLILQIKALSESKKSP